MHLTSSEHLQIFLEIATEAAAGVFYKVTFRLDAITEKDVLEITEADKPAVILDVLHRHPNHSILAEESGNLGNTE